MEFRTYNEGNNNHEKKRLSYHIKISPIITSSVFHMSHLETGLFDFPYHTTIFRSILYQLPYKITIYCALAYPKSGVIILYNALACPRPNIFHQLIILYSNHHLKSYPTGPTYIYATIFPTLRIQPTSNTEIPHEIYA